MPVRTWRLRGLCAKIRGPYQDKSDRVAGQRSRLRSATPVGGGSGLCLPLSACLQPVMGSDLAARDCDDMETAASPEPAPPQIYRRLARAGGDIPTGCHGRSLTRDPKPTYPWGHTNPNKPTCRPGIFVSAGMLSLSFGCHGSAGGVEGLGVALLGHKLYMFGGPRPMMDDGVEADEGSRPHDDHVIMMIVSRTTAFTGEVPALLCGQQSDPPGLRVAGTTQKSYEELSVVPDVSVLSLF